MYRFYQKIEASMASNAEDADGDGRGVLADMDVMKGKDQVCFTCKLVLVKGETDCLLCQPADGDDGGGMVHAEVNISGISEPGAPAVVPFTHENVNQFLQTQGLEDGARSKKCKNTDEGRIDEGASDEDAHGDSEACSGFDLGGAASDTERGGGGVRSVDLSPSFLEAENTNIGPGGGAVEDFKLFNSKLEVKASYIEDEAGKESVNKMEGGGSMFSRRTGRGGEHGEDQDTSKASSTTPFESVLQAVESGFLQTIDRVNLLHSPPRSNVTTPPKQSHPMP